MTDLIASTPVTLRLKPGRQFPFLARHPWVHAHALADPGDACTPGQVVELQDHDGNWIARGVINPGSRLRVRLYSFDSGVAIDDALWARRIAAAIDRRRNLIHANSDADEAERLVFSESDLISGLIVDRYADALSVQITSAGLLRWKDTLLGELKSQTGCRVIKVRLDEKTAKHESTDVLDQWHDGIAHEGPITYRQNGLSLTVTLSDGQKTGGYLDQRVNHAVAAGYLKGRSVLDVCCYHGGFGLVAAAAGATSVVGVDSSEPALQSAMHNVRVNGLSGIELIKDDCFDVLGKFAAQGRTFGGVVLDPPRFAGSRHQLDAAMRAYLRLNASAIDLIESGGVLVTNSCSGRVSRSDFLNMLLDAGRRRRRDLILLENRGPAPDHPVAMSCPESDYLKCVICQVV